MTLRILIAALVLISTLSAAAQQVRDTRGASTPAPTGTGVISGVATSDDGSRPVRYAYVVLIGIGTGTVKVSSTDGDGRFLFANLPADRYTIGASKAPYLGTVAGARRPARPGTPIALADGQKIADVAVRMPLGAAITGVITDEKGQPVGSTMVALQQWRMQNGERVLAAVQANGATDERGRYRFYGLAPGEYVIVAMRVGGLPAASRTLSTTEVDAALKGGPVPQYPPVQLAMPRYAPVYYPGSTRLAEAQSVTLAAGEERQNIDFRLELVQTARVEGTVVTSDGQMVTSGNVLLSTAGQSILRTAQSSRIMPDGRFAFPSVAPGVYSVVSTGIPPNAGQYAHSSVEVTGADVLGVQLVMRPPLTFAGRLVFRGTAPAPSIASRRVPLRAMAGVASGQPAPNVSPTTADGTFTVTNVFPGRYVIGGPLAFGPTSDSMTWSLESVMVDGRDVTDLPVDINADTLPKEVIVTFSDRVQELTGRLTRSNGTPAPEHTVIVFPEDKAYWVFGSRRIAIARPGTDGRFTLSGAGPTTLPPGKYRLAAVTDIDRDEQFDPAFLSALVPASVPITLQPGEKKVQDLAIK